ncbi:Tetratricopeptide repeat [Carpediemonas membranifera]|uniref:Tetratricopeptide repeat n=1 Tax=Carpediemonas membranifera TaxID=201153 RepID=A0A8J6DYW0_9EUKA|nr:Tetratricopeptide repeat [Carpediemonas membranifera]|eukprot:KAG9389636.1 Tetratricopeptide repeat [Carpediemonas membranifera]
MTTPMTDGIMDQYRRYFKLGVSNWPVYHDIIAHLDDGRWDQAAALCERLLFTNKDQAGIHLILASIYLALGDVSSVTHSLRATLRCNISNEVTRTVTPLFVEILIAKSQSTLRRGNKSGAAMILDEAMQHTHIPPALLQRAVLHTYNKAYSSALEDVQRAIRLTSPNPDISVAEAALMYLNEHHADAFAALQRCLVMDANHRGGLALYSRLKARLSLGISKSVAHLIAGHAEAESEAESVLSVDPNSIVALVARSLSRYTQGRTMDAAQDMQTAWTAANQMTDTELRHTAFPLGRVKELYLAVLRSGAMANLQAGAPLEVVLTALNQAIRIAPDDATLRTSRGDAFMAFGDVDLAMSNYMAALTRAPESRIVSGRIGAIHFRAGVAALNAGDTQLAAGHVANACEVDPDNVEHWILRAKIAGIAGRHEDEFDCLSCALDLSPRHGEARTMLARLCPGGVLPARYT